MTSPSPFEVLLFDLGGVLIDFAGFEELAQLLPAGIDRAEVRRRWISSRSVQSFERAEIAPLEFAEGVINELGLDLTADDFIRAFVQWARGPYPGATSLLERLQGSFQLACLSNSNELHTPLHRSHVEPLFDSYYFSDEIGLVKPEPAIFEFVISDLNVRADRIVFFDDTAINVEAARAAGMHAHEVDGVAALQDRLLELGILSPAPSP
jgi:putative hydrolase of the HAD superfamily